MSFVEVTRSELSCIERCERKWYYRYHLSEPEVPSQAMSEGTLGHIGLEAAYKHMRLCQQEGTPFHIAVAKSEAEWSMIKAVQKGVHTYHGKEEPLGIKPEQKDILERMIDVVYFYLDQHALSDYDKYEVLYLEHMLETAYYLPFLTQQTQVIVIQIDSIMRDRTAKHVRFATVMDHKFVGDVKASVAHLPLNLQMMVYEDIVWQALCLERGLFDDVEIYYDCQKREVPPGYGHRELRHNKDGSVAKNNASQKPEDYFKRHRLYRSKRDRDALRENIVIPLLATRWEHANGRSRGFMRRPIQTGGESCDNCFFQAKCAYDALGRHKPDLAAAFAKKAQQESEG